MKVDKLKLLFGKEYEINDKISIRNPTIGEIYEFGEAKYFSMISNLVVIPSDIKSILFDAGIDYEEITEFELFTRLLEGFNFEDTKIILGDLNLQEMGIFVNQENKQIFLSDTSNFLDEIMTLENEELDKFISKIYDDDSKIKVTILVNKLKNNEIELDLFKKFFNDKIFEMKFPKHDGIIIDMHVYILMTEIIREMHNFEKKIEYAGNAGTKKLMIDLDRDDREANARKGFVSMLEPLVLAAVNDSGFKYDFDGVKNLSIKTFLASIGQIQKAKSYNYKMQGIHAGTIDAKKINKKELTWI